MSFSHVGADVASKRDDALVDGHPDILRVDTGFPIEGILNVLLQVLVGHGLLQSLCLGLDVATGVRAA